MAEPFILSTIFSLCVGGLLAVHKDDPYAQQRQRMVEDQIAKRGIADERVLSAMRQVKRHLFVPENVRPEAYEDHPLAIGSGQTISQPYIVASMTEALHLNPPDKVLEIGTGSGYQAAVLGELVKEVYSIEVVPELAASAAGTLRELGYQNIKVKPGDGFEGWQEHAPYNAIIVTAAPEEIPQELLEQLTVGGRMVIPIGSDSQDLYLLTKTAQGIKQERLYGVRFVPMIKSNDNQ